MRIQRAQHEALDWLGATMPRVDLWQARPRIKIVLAAAHMYTMENKGPVTSKVPYFRTHLSHFGFCKGIDLFSVPNGVVTGARMREYLGYP